MSSPLFAKTLVFAAALAALVLPGPSAADHTLHVSAAAAVNKAGRQRMLGQLLIKEYLQIAERVDAPVARGHLLEAVQVFDDQLIDLRDFAGNDPDLLDGVADVSNAWAGFRDLVSAPASVPRARALQAAGERLLEAAERNTTLLERHTGSGRSRLVNLSGRQGMLSQRIAKDYLMIAGRIEPELARAELVRAGDEFSAALAVLRAAPRNGEEIRAALDATAAHWRELQPLLRRERDTAERRARVIELTDAILERMEHATGLYERLH
jgi:hypothetical protein